MITSKTLVDMSTVPKNYHDFVDIFNKFKVGKLADHWPYNLKINPGWGHLLPYGPITPCPRKNLWHCVSSFMRTGLIHPFSLPLSSSPLYLEERQLSLTLCHFQVLNQISKKDWYPLPLIYHLLDTPQTTQVYTQIDSGTHIIFLYGFHLEMNERLHSEPLMVHSSGW